MAMAESNKEQYSAAIAQVDAIKQKFRDALECRPEAIMQHSAIMAAVEKATKDAITKALRER